MSTGVPPFEAAAAGPRTRSLNSLAIQLSAFALTFILVALLVVTSSKAAFVAQNENITNTVTAAAIDLGDNDSNGAMFNSTGLVPGTSVQKCIDVTYTGNIDPLLVKIYATAPPTGTLGTYLNLTVDVGDDTADAFGSCTNFGGGVNGSTNVYTGTLAGFASAHPDYANSRSTTWDPTGTGQTKTFRFTVSVQDNPSAEGLTSTFGFSWETRTS